MISLKQFFFGDNKPLQNKEYLKDLLNNLQQVKDQNVSIPFVIEKVNSAGFTIKTGGLWGYIAFRYMPWTYKNANYWRVISPFLIKQKFFCSIQELTVADDKIKVRVDGSVHKFKKVTLEEQIPYNAVVLQKTPNGLILELGNHFNWTFGSIIGFAYISLFSDKLRYVNANEGDLFPIFFHGYRADNKIKLGDDINELELIKSDLDSYIGKTVEVLYTEDVEGNYSLWIDQKFEGALPMVKSIYHTQGIGMAKAFRGALKNNERFTCEVIGVKKRERKLRLKLHSKYLEAC